MISRETVRKELAGLFESLTPAAQAVYDYQAAEFEGKSPVVMITSAGTTRMNLTTQGMKARIFFGVHIFVLHADPDSGWTEADAEDALDQVEYEVSLILEAHQRTSYWESIEWEGSSIIDKITVSGDPYLYEVIPIAVEVFK